MPLNPLAIRKFEMKRESGYDERAEPLFAALSQIEPTGQDCGGFDSLAELSGGQSRDLLRKLDALATENVALKAAIAYVCDKGNQPDFSHEGVGCGLEDRGITDRYEAASYGWDKAMDRMYSEVIPCASDIETPATDTYLNSVRAEGIEMAADFLKLKNTVGSTDVMAYLLNTMAFELRAGKDGE